MPKGHPKNGRRAPGAGRPKGNKPCLVVRGSRSTQSVQKKDDGQISRKPLLVGVVGGPGSGKNTLCRLLVADFDFEHLDIEKLMCEEVELGTSLGREIKSNLQEQNAEAISSQLLKNAVARKHQANNFFLGGFPRSLEQARFIEQEIGPLCCVVFLETSFYTMAERIKERDGLAMVERKARAFVHKTWPVIEHYTDTGTICVVQADQSATSVAAEVKFYLGHILMAEGFGYSLK